MSLRVQSLFRLCQSVCAASRICQYQRCLSAGARRYESSSFILGQSEVLLQDGIEIQELPWVIRRLDPREFPFSSSSTRDGRRRYMCGVKDEQFVQQLQECATIHQILRLLEVPGETVTASSAAFALQRLSQLCSATGNDDMDSFIRKAVLHELCETVVQGLSQLPNSTVVSLAGHAALASSGYDVQFVRDVNNEVEKRVGDSIFSVSELCSLIRVLSLGARGDVEVTKNVWIHLGSRYKEIDSANIASVYCVMRYITPDVYYLWKIVEKQLKKCWWKLNGNDIASIASRVAVAGRQSMTTVIALGRWLNANVAVVNDSQLKLLLAAHGDFGLVPGPMSFVLPLERYVSARIANMDRTAVAMCVDLLRRQRWLSTRILDAIARDFEMNASSYELHELFYTLRAYGQLNYVPPNSSGFFDAIERTLLSRFSEFDAASMLEMLISFVYIERFPINFLGHIFSPYFFMQIKGCLDASVRERAFDYLHQLQTAFMLEFSSGNSMLIVQQELRTKPSSWSDGRQYRFHKNVGQALCQLVGDSCVNSMVITRHLSQPIDFEIYVDEANNPLDVTTASDRHAKKIAVLLMLPEHYCINVPQLLGEYAMKQRHVRKLGYEVVTLLKAVIWFCHLDGDYRVKLQHSVAFRINPEAFGDWTDNLTVLWLTT